MQHTKQVKEKKKVIEETMLCKAKCLEAKKIGSSFHSEWVVRDDIQTLALFRMTEGGIYKIMYVFAGALDSLLKLDARLKELNK